MTERLVAVDPSGGGTNSVAGVAWFAGGALVAAASADKHGGLSRLRFHPYGWAGGEAPTEWFASDWLLWRAVMRGWPEENRWPDVARTRWMCLGYRARFVDAEVRYGRRQHRVRVVSGVLEGDGRGAKAPTTLVLERGHGRSARSVDMLARARGYLAALAQEAGVGEVIEMHNASWRHRAGRLFGVSFPRSSEEAKAISLEFAGRVLGSPLSRGDHNMAEAVLIGLAACGSLP
jgi:hypothetical protein